MLVNGCACFIVIKTSFVEMDVPYSSETLREAVSILYEEPSIEGDGAVRGIKKPGGVTGCVVTPLTLRTAPLLLALAFGSAGLPVFVSETRTMYQYGLNLLPLEDANCFDVIQDRGGERKFFEDCRVEGFELRTARSETIKLKLDISGPRPPSLLPNVGTYEKERGERFLEDNVTCRINGQEYTNIYGLTIVSKKERGTKTEVLIKRALQQGQDLPGIIEELDVTVHLLRDSYEERHFGLLRITCKRLVQIGNETEVDSVGAVIGPLRYYAAGVFTAETFISGETA